MLKQALLFAVVCLSVWSCVEPQKTFSKVPPGQWRAVLLLDEKPASVQKDEEVSTVVDRQGELPFNFEIIYDDEENFHIEIINGSERIRVDDITYGRDRATAKDTLIINFPIYDTYIKAIYEEDIMEGDWYVNYKDNYSIPFKAYYGQDHRFATTRVKPAADLSGKWATTFESGTEYAYPAIGEFDQKDNHLTGTFLTETGDYRFLEGTVQGNKAYLSCFDGAHAFLFQSKVLEDGSMTGIFRSGKHYTSPWEAVRDDQVSLGDAFALTTQVGDGPFEFSFPNPAGEQISLADEAYAGKVKLVIITGTWCPNCRDASDFVKEYIEREQPEDVEVISVAFERYADEAKSMDAIRRYKEVGQIPWEVVLGGKSSKREASKRLPQLSGIMSYPTIVFVDQANRIRKIHTGFSGPATSAYADFKQEFAATMEHLRAGH